MRKPGLWSCTRSAGAAIRPARPNRPGAAGLFVVCGLIGLLSVLGIAFASVAREAQDRAHKAYLGQVALDACTFAIDSAAADFSIQAMAPPTSAVGQESMSQALSNLTTGQSIRYAFLPHGLFSPPDATLKAEPVKVQFQLLAPMHRPDLSKIDETKAPELTPEQVKAVRDGFREFFTTGG